ncbi:hypothetical protein ACVWYF_002622 [Hymenobacter sp. UYAg731]
MRFVTAVLVLLLAAGLGACQKNEPAPHNNTTAEAGETSQSLLVGRWELVANSGGFGGGPRPAGPGYKQEIVFLPTGQAQLLLNGAVTSTVHYALTTAPVITGSNGTFITLTPAADFSGTAIYQLTRSELLLSQNSYDGVIFHFSRR